MTHWYTAGTHKTMEELADAIPAVGNGGGGMGAGPGRFIIMTTKSRPLAVCPWFVAGRMRVLVHLTVRPDPENRFREISSP